VLDLNGENEEVGSLSGFNLGQILLGTGTLTVGGNDSSTTYGVISGSGWLTKTGSGVFTLSSDTDFMGPTIVNQGTLLVLGRSASAQHTINAAGRLGGTGTIGPVSVAGGALFPGNPVGLLTSSNVSLNSSAEFEVALQRPIDDAGHSQLNVRGTANLGNAALRVSLGFAPSEETDSH
jgi:autotransporter-associated beta strand protein